MKSFQNEEIKVLSVHSREVNLGLHCNSIYTKGRNCSDDEKLIAGFFFCADGGRIFAGFFFSIALNNLVYKAAAAEAI